MIELINNIKTGISIEDYNHILAELDCAVVETSLPGNCRGMTIKNNWDINYTIIINADLNDSQKKRTLIHELKHIYNNDFLKGKSLLIKENREVNYECSN